MTISMIVAMDQNRVIGKDNDLPWYLPADLKYFKRVTMEHPIIMGRKTYESIGRPLPGRENIILTRNKEYVAEGCSIIHSLDQIEDHGKDQEVFIIGGAEIFSAGFAIAHRLYITHIEAEFEGNTYFPPFDENEWELVSSEQGVQDEKNPYLYFFKVYERRSKNIE